MSFGDYLLGTAGLAIIVASLAVASVRLRAALLPGWSGSPARLAELILGISGLTILLTLLGVVGILDPIPLVAGAAAIGLAVVRLVPAPPEGTGSPPPAPPADRTLTWLALGVALAVAGRWAAGLEYSWEHGMNHFDSLWYHAPFAARFAQEGSITALHFTDPLYLNWFYPQASELQHSTGLLLFGRDLLSPLINMGWLAMTLLAAWCVGRPYRMGPAAVIAVSSVLVTYMMVPREPGNAATDIAPIALLLASAAIFVNASAAGGLSRGALVVAGLATGLAVGTKLTAAAVAGALTIGVAVLARSGDRIRSTGVWTAAMAATGGFWYLRNLIHAGNPLPWLTDIGPLGLPGPDRALEGRDPYSVAHYIFDPSSATADVFLERLDTYVGAGWPVLLLLAVAGMGLAVARGRTPAVRVLGVVAITGAIAYLFTPLTASGPEGTAAGFGVNLRYVAPALALGLALLTIDPWATGDRMRTAVTLVLMPVFVTALLTAERGLLGSENEMTSLLVALVLVGAPIALARLAQEHRVAAIALGAGLATALVAVGWFKQDDYFRDRYRGGVGYGVGPALQVADDLSGKRIALGGSAGAFLQYGFYGKDVSNHVQYVGQNRPNADFVAYEDCPEWRRAVNRGDYDYLVTTGDLNLNYPQRTTPSTESLWAEDPAANLVVRDGQVSVFELSGDLDPEACPPEPVFAP